MLYILLSVCCNVIVAVLLKLARRYHIDVQQAITWNYTTAILLIWLIFKPSLNHLNMAPVNTLVALGVLLPIIFVMLAISIKITGIVRTDIAQRLSLFIPILASFFIFNETLSSLRVVGLIIGLCAMLFSIPWPQYGRSRKSSGAWFYLLAVFVGMGVIDVLFKKLAVNSTMPFTTAIFLIFILAFICSFIGLLVRIARKKTRFSWPHILIGWTLGVANFGNILFYIRAHKALANSPSTVFSSVNMGAIVLGAMVGLFVFKEKLTILNKIGLFLALVSIIVITYSSYN
jgi:drug/metabolite transporter (DMT)-like permease